MCCQFSIQQHLAVSRLSCSSLQKVLMVEAVPKIESTVKASMLKNSFSGHRVLLFFAPNWSLFTFWKRLSNRKKGSGFATPKENINIISVVGVLEKRIGARYSKENKADRISAVDEEHFLVFCWQYSLFREHRVAVGVVQHARFSGPQFSQEGKVL